MPPCHRATATTGGSCGGPTVTIELAVVRRTVTPQKGQKQMVAAACRCLVGYLQAANGHRFSKWTSRDAHGDVGYTDSEDRKEARVRS